MEDNIPDALQLISSPSSSSVVKVSKLPKFLDQWRGITYHRFVFSMVKGHHLQLRCQPPLFHNFKWFNIKTVPAHYPNIEKEVD